MWWNCCKGDSDQNRLVSNTVPKCSNRILIAELRLKPSEHVWGNVFWYPNQYFRHWRKIEKTQKIIIFSCLRGKSGKIEVKDDFDPNQSISNTTRGCRICLLTIKSRPKPFQHVQGNLFWYPNQYFQPWRKFEKSSKITIFGSPDTLLIPFPAKCA